VPVESGRQHLKEGRALVREERASELHEGGDLFVSEGEWERRWG
jgi:hypothetical protein